MSDTPRTDRKLVNMAGYPPLTPASFTMELERELNQWKKLAGDLSTELDIAVKCGKTSSDADDTIKQYEQLRDGRTF